jgi:hypothetical protein
MSALIYEDKPKYDTWLLLLFGGILALPTILGTVRISANTEEGLVLFGVLLFEIILFRLILPRRFQIYNDKLRIVLGGGPLTLNIPLSTIIDVKPRTGIKAFIFTGIRFATSAAHTIEITRDKGLNIVISPVNIDMFIEQLNQARNEIRELI